MLTIAGVNLPKAIPFLKRAAYIASLPTNPEIIRKVWLKYRSRMPVVTLKKFSRAFNAEIKP